MILGNRELLCTARQNNLISEWVKYLKDITNRYLFIGSDNLLIVPSHEYLDGVYIEII
jgi:hypothetical protein